SLKDLAGFRLLRAEGGGALQELAELPVNDQERFQKVRRFAYEDTTAQMGKSYRYAMIAVTADGYESNPSNEVELTRTAPAAPITPENFKLPMPTPLPGLPTPAPSPGLSIRRGCDKSRRYPKRAWARGPGLSMNYFTYKDDRLFAEEIAISDLAARFGTPLYVYSTRTL